MIFNLSFKSPTNQCCFLKICKCKVHVIIAYLISVFLISRRYFFLHKLKTYGDTSSHFEFSVYDDIL